jgi:hypothetical protein
MANPQAQMQICGRPSGAALDSKRYGIKERLKFHAAWNSRDDPCFVPHLISHFVTEPISMVRRRAFNAADVLENAIRFQAFALNKH